MKPILKTMSLFVLSGMILAPSGALMAEESSITAEAQVQAEVRTEPTKPGVRNSAQNFIQERKSERDEKINERKAEMDEKKDANRAEFEAKKVERKENAEMKKTEMKDRMDENREKNVKKVTDLMIKRFEAAIERLETLISRIESRMEKLENDGKDTSAAEAHVENAKSKIAGAKITIASFPSAIESAVSSETSFSVIKEMVVSTKRDLHDAHVSLQKTIPILKSVRGEIKAETNSSATVETVQ
jgi:DNA repair exonuclease SbcCD ATPase subunit